MSMTSSEKRKVEETIAASLRTKLENYKPKKNDMPFHNLLLGKDTMQLFSFVHSVNTTVGTSIYKPLAKVLGEVQFSEVATEKKLGEFISARAQEVIQGIMNDLMNGDKPPCQQIEVEEIRRVCQEGKAVKIKTRQVDIYLVNSDNKHYPIEIKTAKPNIGSFETHKKDLLNWTAKILHENPQAEVGAMLAIPYNPNAPDEYSHWTMRNTVERGTQIKVADEFWDFLADKPVYEDLLECFERVGHAMREEICDFIKRLSMTKQKTR